MNEIRNQDMCKEIQLIKTEHSFFFKNTLICDSDLDESKLAALIDVLDSLPDAFGIGIMDVKLKDGIITVKCGMAMWDREKNDKPLERNQSNRLEWLQE